MPDYSDLAGDGGDGDACPSLPEKKVEGELLCYLARFFIAFQ
mgnify:FL=1